MIVAWDEEFASVKLYHDIKDVSVKPYEVIPIEDLLDAWEKQKAEQTEPMKTTDYCKKCNHKGCETCAADGSNPYCVPSRYEPKTEPQIKQSEEFKQFIGHDCSKCRWSKYGEACAIPCCDFEPKDEPQRAVGNKAELTIKEGVVKVTPMFEDEPQTDCAWK